MPNVLTQARIIYIECQFRWDERKIHGGTALLKCFPQSEKRQSDTIPNTIYELLLSTNITYSYIITLHMYNVYIVIFKTMEKTLKMTRMNYDWILKRRKRLTCVPRRCYKQILLVSCLLDLLKWLMT